MRRVSYLRRAVEHEFRLLGTSPWDAIANAAWLGEQRRKRQWGADAWRFDAERRRRSRAAVQHHYAAHRADEVFRAKNRAKCRAYRQRRKLDPARDHKAKEKRKAAYAREWASLRANPVRYAKALAWTRAWRARQKGQRSA